MAKISPNGWNCVICVGCMGCGTCGFTPEKIKRMSDYFVESSDMGKLYLNYPMVEAFYHSVPARFSFRNIILHLLKKIKSSIGIESITLYRTIGLFGRH